MSNAVSCGSTEGNVQHVRRVAQGQCFVPLLAQHGVNQGSFVVFVLRMCCYLAILVIVIAVAALPALATSPRSPPCFVVFYVVVENYYDSDSWCVCFCGGMLLLRCPFSFFFIIKKII